VFHISNWGVLELWLGDKPTKLHCGNGTGRLIVFRSNPDCKQHCRTRHTS